MYTLMGSKPSTYEIVRLLPRTRRAVSWRSSIRSMPSSVFVSARRASRSATRPGTPVVMGLASLVGETNRRALPGRHVGHRFSVRIAGPMDEYGPAIGQWDEPVTDQLHDAVENDFLLFVFGHGSAPALIIIASSCTSSSMDNLE